MLALVIGPARYRRETEEEDGRMVRTGALIPVAPIPVAKNE